VKKMAKIWSLILLFGLFASSAVAQPQTNVATLPVNYGGAQVYRNIDIDEADVGISATPATLYGWHIFNSASSTRFFKFFNAGTANVTVGATAPFLTIPLPAGAAANVYFPQGIRFSSAITIACVTGVADNSTGAPAANECVGNIFFKN
jgi:hypothetical protein